MRDLVADLRYALRTLSQAPVFTLVAVLSLALGIGANAAIFSLLDKVLLRLLPVQNPEELVLLSWRGSWYGSNTGSNALSYPLYKDFRDSNEVFSTVFCRYALPLNVGYAGQTERIEGELVSGNYFQALGVKAAVGRTLTPEDDRTPGGHPLAILSYDYWMNRFAGKPDVVGKTLVVNAHTLTVIGVSEKKFNGVDIARSPKIRIPVAMKKEMTPGFWAEVYNLENRRARWVNVFGRLKPGVTRTKAQASLQPFFHSLLEMDIGSQDFSRASKYAKDQYLKSQIEVLPAAQGRPSIQRVASTPLWILMAIVGLVLLIACANVANMLLARGMSRQKELAVRLALGASRGRIVGQLMAESVLLAVLGGGLGVLFAIWTGRALLQFVPEDISLKLSAAPDLRILLFSAGVSLLTALLFGLVPALQATRISLNSALKEETGAVAGGKARLRKSLVVAQVFLSCLLLISAGLFTRTLANLRNLNPGFRTSNLIAFSVDPPLSGYGQEQTKSFYRRLSDQLGATAGMESAAVAVVRVLSGDDWSNTISVEGYESKPGENMNPFFNAVSPGYFSTLGVPIVAGRDFNWNDASGRTKVGIVNEKFARYYFKDRSALGGHFGFGGNPGTKTDIEIVGVIKDAKYENMRDEIPRQVFVPFIQSDWATSMTAYVRTRLDAGLMFRSIRQTVHDLDANLPIYAMRTMDAQLEQSLSLERLVASLSAAFSVLATLLAAVGLYGVTAYSVARRTREIGIRMALGAGRRHVGWMVMKEVCGLVVAGVTLALPVTLAAARLVRSQLFGITPADAGTIAASTVGLVVVALLAGYVPTRRATQVDPIRALRYE